MSRLPLLPPLVLGLGFATALVGPPRVTAAPLDDESVEALLAQEAPEPAPRRRRRYRDQVERTASNRFVITREQIRAVNPKHPAEMLRYVPGFVVLRRNQTSYEISTFGTGDSFANKVLILLDGHRVISPDYGNPIWNLIPMVQDGLDRIEIQMGPESNLYGSNAFAAVVDFITRSPQEEEQSLTLRTGTDSSHQIHLNYATRTQGGATRIMASNEHLGGLDPYRNLPGGTVDRRYQEGDRHGRSAFRVQHRRKLDGRTEMDFSLGLTDGEHDGLIPGVRMAQGSTEGRSRSLHMALDLERALSRTRRLELHADFQRLHMHDEGRAPAHFGIQENAYSSSQSELDLRYRWEAGPWRLTSGVSERLVGLATPFTQSIDSQSTTGLYLRGEREIGEKWTLFAGARRILQEAADDVTSWKAASLYRPRPDLGFRLSVGNSFRSPDYYGLFLRSVDAILAPAGIGGGGGGGPGGPLATYQTTPSVLAANPDLRSEKAELFVQFGIEKRWHRERASLNLYRARLEDFVGPLSGTPAIQLVLAGGGLAQLPFSQVQMGNLGVRHVRGISLSYQRDLPGDLHLQLGAHVQDLDGTDSQVEDPYTPPRSASLLLYRPTKGKRLGGSLALRAVDAYGLSYDLAGSGYGVVDLNLERELSPRASLALTVRNLFDNEHFEVVDVWNSFSATTLGAVGQLFGREGFLTFRWKL